MRELSISPAVRVRVSLVFLSFAFLFAADRVAAQSRLTDISGREVVIDRGPRTTAKLRAETTSLRQGPNLLITVVAGADADAANNDFRRIQNAINAAGSGDTIDLSGTFDFTAPFAAAAWALGNDNTAATADDYSVYVPAGLNNVTFTSSGSNATIQGPGDLAAVNLEGFLYFDGGDNQNWTISNLNIFDFDLAIGMFFGTGGTDAFNGTSIVNNTIRIPADLNATVAPADVNQNIGIHYAFGTGQTIQNNIIQFAGGGISDGASFSSSVGMQSNTSGGSVYDGLLIANNQLIVLTPQSAQPERILGIWENGHAHTSNINVQFNVFTNPPGNDPAVNGQRGFRVTSHSSVITTVAYTGNQVTGTNIGFEWLAGSDFSGNLAVTLIENTITSAATGILVQSTGVAHLNRNTITGSGSGGGLHVVTGSLTGSGINPNAVTETYLSGGAGDGIWIEAGAGAIGTITANHLGSNLGFGLRNETAVAVGAERNWWGSNLQASVAAEVSGPADFDPWLASGTDVAPGTPGFQPFLYATTSGTLTTLAGTPAPDTAALTVAGPVVTMQMAGQTATTLLAELVSVHVALDAGDDFFTLGQLGVPVTVDGGADNDTLIGTNVAQTWNVTGANAGDIPGATSAFSAIESLRGGTAADSFVFGAAGNLTGTVDGNLGVDTLNNAAVPAATITPTGPGTLDGFMGTATGMAGFDNINLVAGLVADLVVTKSGPLTADAGSPISYSIVVTNNGPSAALNVTLSDPLPAGTTFLSVTIPGGWSCTTPAVGAGGTVTCTNPSLAAGPAPFTLNVNAPATPSNITNTATVASANESVPGNESANASTAVGFANLSVTKTGPATAEVSAPIAYTITVNNGGPSAAVNVTLTDPLPPGTTFLSLTSPGGWSCTTPAVGAGGTVTCTIASLSLGPGVYTLNVTSPATPANITNTATVSSVSENTPGDESASANTSVGFANLSVTKTGPATADASAPIAYTITVNNGGPSAAVNVTLTDPLPPGTTFVSLTSPGGWSCTTPAVGAGGTVSCTIASLPLGPAAFTLTVTSPATPSNITNTATVTSAGESAPGNESASANTSAGFANLSMTKTGPPTATAGAPISYSITATNNGPSAAANVTISDPLPAGTTFVSLTSPGGWSCTTPAVGAGGTVTCTMASMPLGPAAFTLNVTAPLVSTTITNTATVTSAGESAPGDESASVNTSIGVVVVTVSKTGPATADVSAPISYSITVTNNGPGPALNVTLTDALPAGTTFLSLTSPGGWSCTTPAVGAGGTVTCSIASMPLGPAAFTLDVTAPATPSIIANNVSVTSTSGGIPPPMPPPAVVTRVGFANLSVTKTGPATANASAPIAYTITVTNGGPYAASTVSLTDPLPPGVTFVSLSSPAGWSCTTPAVGAGGTVTCTIASLATGTYPFTLSVTSPAAPGPISNTATVASTNEDVPGNESATTPTTIGGVATLVTTKTGPPTAVSGTPITYNISVLNNGPSAATGVVVTDVLPAGVSFVSATPSQGSCSGTTTVTCSLGTLANAATATVALTVNVTATSGTITNSASATSAELNPTPLSATGSSPPATVVAPGQVPTLSTWVLLAMMTALGVIAVTKLR